MKKTKDTALDRTIADYLCDVLDLTGYGHFVSMNSNVSLVNMIEYTTRCIQLSNDQMMTITVGWVVDIHGTRDRPRHVTVTIDGWEALSCGVVPEEYDNVLSLDTTLDQWQKAHLRRLQDDAPLKYQSLIFSCDEDSADIVDQEPVALVSDRSKQFEITYTMWSKYQVLINRKGKGRKSFREIGEVLAVSDDVIMAIANNVSKLKREFDIDEGSKDESDVT